MRNKSLFMATTALALLAGATTATAGDLYISVIGGLNKQPDESGGNVTAEASGLFDTSPDTGFTIGGAIGTGLDKWVKGLRVEAEVAYRRNDLAGRWATFSFTVPGTTTARGDIEGNASTFSIMANAWYDIDAGWKVVPYVGGGVGWGRAKVDGVLVTTFSDGTPNTGSREAFSREDSGFAWQLGAGFNYEAAPGVKVGLGYRYFRGPTVPDPIFTGKNDVLVIGFENENHAVQANVTIDIN